MRRLQVLDGLGRPTLRLIGVVLTAVIGAAIAFAFWRWAMGSPIPPLPGEAIMILLVSQFPQIMDQVTRSWERRKQIENNQLPWAQNQPHKVPEDAASAIV